MNFNVNDNPLLVAPRPVRLTTAACPHFTCALKFIDDPTQDKDHASPSPRSSSPISAHLRHSASLPSEALEEFLSILRPAIFPPSSPVLRPRRNGALAFGVAYMAKPKIDSSFAKSDQPNLLEEFTHTPACSPEPISDHLPGNWDIFGPEISSRWHAQVLASPISRLQTRNPFSRHAAHDITLSPIRSSPSIASTPLSPSTIPLPAPSPDETLEVF